MRRLKALVCLIIALIMLVGSTSYSVKAAGVDYSSMDRREFVLHLVSLGGKSYKYPWTDGEFMATYQKYMIKGSFGEEYPWASTSFEEFDLLSKGGYIDMSQPAFNTDGSKSEYHKRRIKYNEETGYDKIWESYKEQARLNGLEIKNKKMWANSKLEGDANSHGALTQKEEEIYQRPGEDGKPQIGTELGIGSFNMDEPSGVTKVIMEFLCWIIFHLADGIDSILTTGGIALDNVIFGRVAGYGVITEENGPVITLFGFELSNGNPYGYIGAMLFQRIRSYVYVFMAVLCLFKMVKIAASTDYMKMKMDFSTFLQNALLSFTFIVMMPYIFDIYLYIRDVLLKAVTFGTLQDLFGTTGFLASFRACAESSKANIIPNLIYLGAVILSLVVAGIYVAYAMSMMVHFILFPFVCLRGISNSGVYKEWAMETLGLTIMPLIDGMLLIIPLTFSDMANGNLAFNLLSLVSCGMLLTARKQARRSLGIKENGLDMGAMATVMGIGQLAKGIGKTVGKTFGKMGKGLGAAKESLGQAIEDGNMSRMYSQEPNESRVEAPNTAAGAGGFGGASSSGGGLSPSNLAKHVNMNNFDKGPFRGNIDNETTARLYRQRATKGYFNAIKKSVGAVGSGVGGLAGGVIGATVGFGAGAFMGPGARAALTGAGMDLGSSIGVAGANTLAEGTIAVEGLLGQGVGNGTAWAINKISGRKGAATGGQNSELNVPAVTGTEQSSASGGGVVEVDMLDGDARYQRMSELYDQNKAAYDACTTEAIESMQNHPAMEKNEDFIRVRMNVTSKMEGLCGRARNGESPTVLINGEGGFKEVRKSYETDVAGVFKKRFTEIAKQRFGADGFSESNQTDMDVLDNITKNLMDKGKGSILGSDWNKKHKVDMDAWKAEILRECARHNHVFNDGK